jgi:D-lactate dehydrogenase (cytochrome)
MIATITTMSSTWIPQLISLLPADQLSQEVEVLSQHSHDSSTHPAHQPEIVIWPLSTMDVVKVVQVASQASVPVTVCGTRTGLEGNALPVNGGITLDMTRMNKILEVKSDDFQVVVQPGIIGTELNKQLESHHLMFPAFPASANIASIGGMIANNAGGMYAVKYGVVGNWVMALEVVLADGSVIHVGSQSIKSVAGYDLKSLIIGSEGTLGIITQATLRLLPEIPHKSLVMASFIDIMTALKTTLEIIHSGGDPAAMEMLDGVSIKYVNQLKSLNWPANPTLLIELHGEEGDVARRCQLIEGLCQKAGALQVKIADTEAEMAAIWEVRTAVHPAIMAAHPNSGVVPGDIGVPLSQIPAFMTFVEETAQRYQQPAPTFGHIGDGNFHFWLVFEKNNPQSLAKAKQVAGLLVTKALELGGTCTAEHGVGIGKQSYVAREHADSLPLMKLIKQSFDPRGILNPGKIFE